MMNLFNDLKNCLKPETEIKCSSAQVEINYLGVVFDVNFTFTGYDRYGLPVGLEETGIFFENNYFEEELKDNVVLKIYEIAKKELYKHHLDMAMDNARRNDYENEY